MVKRSSQTRRHHVFLFSWDYYGMKRNALLFCFYFIYSFLQLKFITSRNPSPWAIVSIVTYFVVYTFSISIKSVCVKFQLGTPINFGWVFVSERWPYLRMRRTRTDTLFKAHTYKMRPNSRKKTQTKNWKATHTLRDQKAFS